MATIVQQIHPVAHLPLVLGVLRRLEVATVIDRLIPPHPAHSSRVVAGSKPWSSRFWMGIMPSTRWGHGWKRGGCWRCCNRASHAPRSMITAWATSSRRCLRPISTRCIAPLLSTHWRSMPLPHHGCIRTRRLLPCMEHTQTNRRPPEPPGRPMAIAKTGVRISNRCSSVSGAAAMAGSRCASGCGTATAVIVWRRRWRLRSVWRWAARGYAGSWRLVRPIVAVPWVCVSNMDSG